MRAARDRSVVDSVAQQVRRAPRVAPTGRWTQPQLTQRLVSAGLAPRRGDSVAGIHNRSASSKKS